MGKYKVREKSITDTETGEVLVKEPGGGFMYAMGSKPEDYRGRVAPADLFETARDKFPEAGAHDLPEPETPRDEGIRWWQVALGLGLLLVSFFVPKGARSSN